MNVPLKILHLEASARDAGSIGQALTAGGLVYKRMVVHDSNAYTNALPQFRPHILLCDGHIPGWEAHEALALAQQTLPGVPFLLVTHPVSEMFAVSMLKSGAADYILKENLQQLPDAIRQCMKAVEHNLQDKYRQLFQQHPIPMLVLDQLTNNLLDANDAAIAQGYTKNNFTVLQTGELTAPVPGNNHTKGKRRKGPEKQRANAADTCLTVHPILFDNKPANLVLVENTTLSGKRDIDWVSSQLLSEKLVAVTSVQAQEQEREEIGKELHDNINQVLNATRLYLEFAMVAEPGLVPELLEKSYKNVVQVIDEIRLLSHKLVAPSLENTSLVQAISQLAANMCAVTPLKLTINTEEFDESCTDGNIRLTLYRIVQEQLNNILKHAQSSCATIVLRTLAGYITLTIQDNGRGFDTGTTPRGIGLRNIMHRTAACNGTARILSAPGQGCTLEVIIPARKNGRKVYAAERRSDFFK
jgi:DNA-binding NarL/FixJ family response regulator/two-component sensor histidine kinase